MYAVMHDEHTLTVGNSVGYSSCYEVELILTFTGPCIVIFSYIRSKSSQCVIDY